jgi:heparan-sulfate lyase
MILSVTFFLTALPGFAMQTDQAVRAEIERFNEKFNKPPLDLSAKTILSLLDLSHPGLEAVKVAAENHDEERALNELLLYFKTEKKYITIKKEDTQTKYRKELADLAVNHIIKGNKNYDPVYRGTKLDWVGKAVIDGDVIDDAEWLCQYHRLYWWTFLAKAYEETGKKDYFYEWRYELVNYTDDMLPMDKDTLWSCQRGMETYYRCKAAMWVFPTFIMLEEFDTKLLRYFLAFFHHHAEHIRRVYADGGNHLLGELTAVFDNGLFFPEFKKSKEWISDGVTKVPAMLKEMVFREGMNKELVFSYHLMYCELFHAFYAQAKNNGMLDKIDSDYGDIVKNLHDIMMIALLPDGSTVQFGDAWKYRKEPDGSFVPRYGDWIYRVWNERYPDDSHYRFLLTNGKEGKAWDDTCFRYTESGFHFFRNEWSRQAIYLALKYGPSARAHNQPDNGAFSLAAYGRDFMIDSGSYIYNSDDPDDQYWRKWFRASKVHQTLTLDNRDITPAPTYQLWHNEDDLTIAVIDNQGYENLCHRRSVLFMDKRFFVIFDEAIGSATGKVRTHFQLTPCEPVMTKEGMIVRTNYETGPNLLLKAFTQSHPVEMEMEEGWISYLYKHKEPRPAFSYAIDKQSENPVSFLTALVPTKHVVSDALSESLTAKVEKKSDNLYQYEITLESNVWKIEVNITDKEVAAICF